MKTSIAALLLAVSAAATAEAGGASAPAAESLVRHFTLACFSARGNEKWLDNALCYDRAQLAEFQRLYLRRSGEMAPGVVPQEFVAYYKGDVSLDKLKAVEPAEFFAAFNGGWSALLAPRGPCKRGATSFEITGMEAGEQGRYLVAGITTARQTCGEKTEEVSRTDTIAVRLQDGKPSVEMPPQTLELLRASR